MCTALRRCAAGGGTRYFRKIGIAALCARWPTITGRAVDRHSAEPHLGHSFVAGLTALVAGIWVCWRAVLVTTHSLRALPVRSSWAASPVPGAIIGGLIIGVGEKLSEVYLGLYVGRGIEIWFAYMLALVFLLFRPQGLFHEKIIDRVRDLAKDPRCAATVLVPN
jgi:hypothetical protein